MITLSGLSLGTMAVSFVKMFTNKNEEYQLKKKILILKKEQYIMI